MMEYAPAKPVKNMQEINPLKTRRLKYCPENEYLVEKRSLEGKYEIFRTISQPGALSADIPANQMLLIYFITHLFNFVSKVD